MDDTRSGLRSPTSMSLPILDNHGNPGEKGSGQVGEDIS